MKTQIQTHHTKAYTDLLKAACQVEAHSHIDLEANEYHVDVLAMANLCGAIAKASRQILSAHNRKLEKIQNAEAVVYRSAPPGLPAKEWHFASHLNR